MKLLYNYLQKKYSARQLVNTGSKIALNTYKEFNETNCWNDEDVLTDGVRYKFSIKPKIFRVWSWVKYLT